MKLFVMLLCLGGVRSKTTRPEVQGFKDLTMVLIVLYYLFIPAGELLGYLMIVTVATFMLANLYFQKVYPVWMEEEVLKAQSEASTNAMVVQEIELKTMDIVREVAEFRGVKREYYDEINSTINGVNNIIYNNNKDLDNPELFELLSRLETLYCKPRDDRKMYRVNLFDNLHSIQSKKRAKKTLTSLRKDTKYGDGFDRELRNYIDILDKSIEMQKERKLLKRKGKKRKV